jgi:tripartite-type tricarboxylate transporter receptor subunit TctC
MKLPRRNFLHLAAGAAALPALPRIASAQPYPSRPVRIIVGFTAGGNFDLTARLVSQWLSQRLGQQFIVENRPGAGTNIATEAVVRAPADGYTLLLGGAVNAINATLYEKLNFDFMRDVAPVASLIRFPNVIDLNPSFPAKTIPEFIAYAKANPGKVNMASSGKGTSQHLSGELFKMMTGVDLIHVPYRGAPQALTDLIGGQVQVSFDPLPPAIQLIKSGQVRALAVTTATRSAPGRSNRRRVRTGLRGERMERHRLTQKHADRNHSEAQQRDQCGSGRSWDQSEACRPGRRRGCRLAYRLRQAHRCRDREVGQRGQVRGPQA